MTSASYNLRIISGPIHFTIKIHYLNEPVSVSRLETALPQACISWDHPVNIGISSIILRRVTITPKSRSKYFMYQVFKYFSITFSEEVSLTCRKTVKGSWMLGIAWEIINP